MRVCEEQNTNYNVRNFENLMLLKLTKNCIENGV